MLIFAQNAFFSLTMQLDYFIQRKFYGKYEEMNCSINLIDFIKKITKNFTHSLLIIHFISKNECKYQANFHLQLSKNNISSQQTSFSQFFFLSSLIFYLKGGNDSKGKALICWDAKKKFSKLAFNTCTEENNSPIFFYFYVQHASTFNVPLFQI